MKCLDEDERPTGAGDTIEFSYGAPPVRVEGKVVYRNGELFVLAPGHDPEIVKLSSLRRYVGQWWKKGEP